MLDLFGIHIVGFPTRRLNCKSSETFQSTAQCENSLLVYEVFKFLYKPFHSEEPIHINVFTFLMQSLR